VSKIIRSQRLSAFGSILPDGEIALELLIEFRLIVEIEKLVAVGTCASFDQAHKVVTREPKEP
jgi:hypothetical protein